MLSANEIMILMMIIYSSCIRFILQWPQSPLHIITCGTPVHTSTYTEIATYIATYSHIAIPCNLLLINFTQVHIVVAHIPGGDIESMTFYGKSGIATSLINHIFWLLIDHFVRTTAVPWFGLHADIFYKNSRVSVKVNLTRTNDELL